jgi:hypothetical protein
VTREELGVGPGTHGDQDHVAADLGAVCQDERPDPAVRGVHGGQARAETKIHACRAHALAQTASDPAPEDTGEGRLQCLHDRHPEPQAARAGGDLGADEARPEHGEALAGLQVGSQALGVAQAAQVMHAPNGRHLGEPARTSSRGEHQVPPTEPAAGEQSRAVPQVDRADRLLEAQVDATLDPEPGWAQADAPARPLADEELLRERRSLVGRAGLVAGDHDAAVMPPRPQRLGAARAGQPGAHDQHVGGVHGYTTTRPAASTTRMAPIGHSRAAATAASWSVTSTRATAIPSGASANVSGSRSAQAPKPLHRSRSMTMR